jgi:hypothetical protein
MLSVISPICDVVRVVLLCRNFLSGSEPEVLEVAMERLSRLVAKVRRMEFVDLNETTLRGVL